MTATTKVTMNMTIDEMKKKAAWLRREAFEMVAFAHVPGDDD